MNQTHIAPDALLASIFSDGTPLFRQPAEPEPWDAVAVRLRIRCGAEVTVHMLRGFPAEPVRMSRYKTDALFDWYEAKLYCRTSPIFYSFLIQWEGRTIHYNRTGAHWMNSVPSSDPTAAFRVIPGFHVPAWARGALQYQIFPDRFRDGLPENDTVDREYWYANGYIRRAPSWDALPQTDDYRCLYGGDLQGVMEKLDYLQSLGVEAIYFNPIFVSPSGHRYDTQDYDHVDPHLTFIPRDGGAPLRPGETDNAFATKYIQRTTDPVNLDASDAWFAFFCREVHRRGMKIILDGVFNHCGSFHRWMNREGVYPRGEGAYGHPDSPYRSYFGFRSDTDYDCWWDVETVPKLYYEQSQALCSEILRIAEKWALPPWSIDGWRLDVAADLGLTDAFNHLFWKEFRRRVKAVNPDILIIAEHYGDPSPWLGGEEWDTVMNYDAFMDPLSHFFTGVEKHSDYLREDLYQNGPAFFEGILAAMSRLPTPSLYCAMDQLSNHDHSRFMTRTNGRVGRLHTAGSDAAGEDIKPGVFREAAVVQMTWPGAPTIYYGDEAGLVGWTDPDNRRTYPWGREDKGLIELHRALAALRQAHPVLREGSLKPLLADHGHIAYARFDADSWVAVACNNTDMPATLALPLGDAGVPDGAPAELCLRTTRKGFDADPAPAGTVAGGRLELFVPPYGACVVAGG